MGHANRQKKDTYTTAKARAGHLCSLKRQLKNTVIPTDQKSMSHWRRYIHSTLISMAIALTNPFFAHAQSEHIIPMFDPSTKQYPVFNQRQDNTCFAQALVPVIDAILRKKDPSLADWVTSPMRLAAWAIVTYQGNRHVGPEWEDTLLQLYTKAQKKALLRGYGVQRSVASQRCDKGSMSEYLSAVGDLATKGFSACKAFYALKGEIVNPQYGKDNNPQTLPTLPSTLVLPEALYPNYQPYLVTRYDDLEKVLTKYPKRDPATGHEGDGNPWQIANYTSLKFNACRSDMMKQARGFTALDYATNGKYHRKADGTREDPFILHHPAFTTTSACRQIIQLLQEGQVKWRQIPKGHNRPHPVVGDKFDRVDSCFPALGGDMYLPYDPKEVSDKPGVNLREKDAQLSIWKYRDCIGEHECYHGQAPVSSSVCDSELSKLSPEARSSVMGSAYSTRRLPRSDEGSEEAAPSFEPEPFSRDHLIALTRLITMENAQSIYTDPIIDFIHAFSETKNIKGLLQNVSCSETAAGYENISNDPYVFFGENPTVPDGVPTMAQKRTLFKANLITQIYNKIPVSVGLCLHYYENPTQTKPKNAAECGPHAEFIYGYRQESNGKMRFYLRNSHGLPNSTSINSLRDQGYEVLENGDKVFTEDQLFKVMFDYTLFNVD